MPADRLRTILIVDDSPTEIKTLTDEFENQGKIVLKAKDDREAVNILKMIPCFDIVILDLLLDGENDTQAKIVLKYIEENYMVPVCIYTNHPEKNPPNSPNVIGSITKSEEINEIKVRIDQFLNGARFIEIGVAWARSVSMAAHRGLITLLPEWARKGAQYNKTLSLLIMGMRSDRRGDASHELEAYDLVTLLTRNLLRGIVQDSDLMKLVSATLAVAEEDEKKKDNEDHEKELKPDKQGELNGDYWKFRELIQYGPAGKELTTGDLLKDTKGNTFVLITPQCDLVDQTNELLTLVQAFSLTSLLSKIPKKDQHNVVHNRTLRYHSIPVGNKSERCLALDFACVLTAKRVEIRDYSRTTTILSPFRDQIVQRYVSYVNRVGVPDIPKEVLDRLHDDLVKEDDSKQAKPEDVVPSSV
jgi:CheY-like chemotaxis protein